MIQELARIQEWTDYNDRGQRVYTPNRPFVNKYAQNNPPTERRDTGKVLLPTGAKEVNDNFDSVDVEYMGQQITLPKSINQIINFNKDTDKREFTREEVDKISALAWHSSTCDCTGHKYEVDYAFVPYNKELTKFKLRRVIIYSYDPYRHDEEKKSIKSDLIQARFNDLDEDSKIEVIPVLYYRKEKNWGFTLPLSSDFKSSGFSRFAYAHVGNLDRHIHDEISYAPNTVKKDESSWVERQWIIKKIGNLSKSDIDILEKHVTEIELKSRPYDRTTRGSLFN